MNRVSNLTDENFYALLWVGIQCCLRHSCCSKKKFINPPLTYRYPYCLSYTWLFVLLCRIGLKRIMSFFYSNGKITLFLYFQVGALCIYKENVFKCECIFVSFLCTVYFKIYPRFMIQLITIINKNEIY